ESPPLSLSVPAALYSRLRFLPFMFYVADLWPDAMRDNLRLSDTGVIMKLARALERWSYRKASYVCAVTEGILDDLKTRGIPLSKLLFLPNGVDLEQLVPMAPDNDLRERLGLPNQSIVLYLGTHGYAHGLERILQAAEVF